MLKVLHIENIAVIERCDIEFHEGFNVLTGETGAGKSIVIDALGAVLGMRTPRDLVRTGEARALVSAIFEKLSATTYDWLRNNGFESEDDTVFIQREISAEGKNSCRLNGRPATVAMIKELGVTLLNIHGQHDSQELMHTDMHAEYIERFASCAEYNDAWSRYCRLFLKLHSLQTEKKSLITDEAEKARREDLLRYQIDELTDADLAENELETLVERRIVLRNATKVLDTLEYLTGLFYGSDEVSGICADLGGAERALFQMPDEVSEIKELAARVADIKYGAEDIASELRAQLEGFDASPA
ncbi:MAG: AAA family ATPase, partial [Oscillospiraceae bacterium]